MKTSLTQGPVFSGIKLYKTNPHDKPSVYSIGVYGANDDNSIYSAPTGQILIQTGDSNNTHDGEIIGTHPNIPVIEYMIRLRANLLKNPLKQIAPNAPEVPSLKEIYRLITEALDAKLNFANPLHRPYLSMYMGVDKTIELHDTTTSGTESVYIFDKLSVEDRDADSAL